MLKNLGLVKSLLRVWSNPDRCECGQGKQFWLELTKVQWNRDEVKDLESIVSQGSG